MTRFKRFLVYSAVAVIVPAAWIGNIWWQNRDDPSIGGGIMFGVVIMCPMIAAFILCLLGGLDLVLIRGEE